MKNLAPIGRILFALPFALFGINHLVMMDFYLGMLTSFIPLGAYTIILTGLIMIAVSVSIITKKFIRLSTLILAGLLLIFILVIHIPHLLGDSSDKTTILITLLKDISLMGGSLMIAGYSQEEPIKKAEK
jgi:uncharacterized membrane protein YphA (DoxX/SURF4 family)